MNENMKLLVAALRSGTYKQIDGRLSNRQGHCCLGIACEIYQAAIGDLVIKPDAHSSLSSTLYDDQRYALPPKVQNWLNVDANAIRVPLNEKSCEFLAKYTPSSGHISTALTVNDIYLSDLNDWGFTFEQIAEVIEAGLVAYKNE